MEPHDPVSMKSLPGYELVEQGLRDLANDHHSIEALLVLIGAPRLRINGIEVPIVEMEAPEHQLYQKLVELDPDRAYGLYNSLIRRLVSFERSLECAV